MNPFKFEPVYVQRFESNDIFTKQLRIETFCGIPFMNNKRIWSYRKCPALRGVWIIQENIRRYGV